MKKYTLITGATSGIGKELAKIFAQNGHDLIIVSRSQESLQATTAELSSYGVKVQTIQKDLFEKNAASEVYAEIQMKGWEVDILVNDAGQGAYGKFMETDLEKELNIIHLNICSLVTLTKHFLKDMIANGEGKILNVSSVASKSPGPYQSVYHGTKAFVQSFTEAIRNEVSEENKNITITALLPGATDTDFFNKAEMQESKIVQDKNQLADPAKVAMDGYEALMAGKDMIVSGLKNKVQVAMAAITPDSMAAENMKKQQEPVGKK